MMRVWLVSFRYLSEKHTHPTVKPENRAGFSKKWSRHRRCRNKKHLQL